MSSKSSAAKENEEPVHTASNTESGVMVGTLDAKERSDEATAGDIKAEDEITGIKLALIIVGLCFSNILTGLVGRRALVDGIALLIHIHSRTSR